MRSFFTLTAFCSVASAHFLLRYPPTIGFDDDKEGTSPCGGFTPDLNGGNLTDFHVGGDAIAVTLTHPQGKWLFRVTTDPTDDKSWEQIYPIVLQSGLGNFCLPQLTVPSKYEGKKGVISIVLNAVDGLLYQCSVVNFVSGSQTQTPSECKNATITASFDSDPQLSALVGNSTSTTATTDSSGSSTATASPTSTPKKNAAGALDAASGVVAVMGAAVMGGLLMV